VKSHEICLSCELIDGGDGIEFDVVKDDEVLPAFAVRYQRMAYAYVNRCSHMELKLNFLHRNFFDLSKQSLICSTHGALYDPVTGGCRGGPCSGVGLQPLLVEELEGKLRLSQNTNVTLYIEEQ
jgi:nitrite reductase/ring-hydroxylating ferredoxin subunit